jgi:S1-C subfamily serine protease
MKAALVALAVSALGSVLLWPRDASPPGWQTPVASVVEVVAAGCGRHGVHGSGAVVRGDQVATVAHLVAGARAVAVRDVKGRRRPARVVALDEERDLALLGVERLDAAAVPRADAIARQGRMLSPGARPEALPFRIARRVRARVDGLERDALEVEADVDPGDSGAALVDARGQLVGIVFAASRGRAAGWAIPADELDALLSAAARAPHAPRC